MKHIKKKFLEKLRLPKGASDSLSKLTPIAVPKNVDLEEMVAWGLNENDDSSQCFS